MTDSGRMTGLVTVLDAIRRELESARAAALDVRHVRVTHAALAGSVVLAPLSPERVRALRPYVVALDCLGGEALALCDPEAVERWREVLVHPADWQAALLARPAHDGRFSAAVTPTSVYGLPVVR